MTDISKDDFNAAVSDAIDAVKPLLLAAEASANAAAATLPEGNTLIADLAALHGELANQLAIADAMGTTGGAHTNSGGGGKGTED